MLLVSQFLETTGFGNWSCRSLPLSLCIGGNGKRCKYGRVRAANYRGTTEGKNIYCGNHPQTNTTVIFIPVDRQFNTDSARSAVPDWHCPSWVSLLAMRSTEEKKVDIQLYNASNHCMPEILIFVHHPALTIKQCQIPTEIYQVMRYFTQQF